MRIGMRLRTLRSFGEIMKPVLTEPR
jgi:hypothetical protein